MAASVEWLHFWSGAALQRYFFVGTETQILWFKQGALAVLGVEEGVDPIHQG